MSMHLLMETAIGDSQHYQVLSFDEVEDLKRELARLSSRIESARRQLAIESKVRDAATSLNKLDAHAGQGRGTDGTASSKPAEEIELAQRKCEDLAQELYRLEKSHQEVQKRMLEHTAGVLQMTHKGYLKKDAPSQPNGFDEYTNGGGLDLAGSSHFDDHSFYRTLDDLLDEGVTAGTSGAFKEQTAAILDIEKRVWEMNQRLREAVAQVSSGRAVIPQPPEPGRSDQTPDSSLQEQVTYLEQGLERMQRGQIEMAQSYKSRSSKTEVRLEDLNTQLRGIVIRSSNEINPQHPLPPNVTGQSTDDQIAFLEQGLDILEQGVSELKDGHRDLSTKSATHEEKAMMYETAIHGLWERMSDGERFSIDSFGSKVSSLNTRVADLSNQKDILNRQIQQQREINSKSDSDKDANLASMTTQRDQASADAGKVRNEMQGMEGEMVRLQTELTVARAELDGAYGTRAQRAAEVAQHPALQQEIAVLKEELENSKSKSAESAGLQQQVHTLQKELSETIGEYEIMTKSSIEFEKDREALENAVDSLRDRCESLEAQLSDERVGKLGVKSEGVPGDRGSNEKGATSTSVLRNEFKKMMRETRAENMRALRVSVPSNRYCGIISDVHLSMSKTSAENSRLSSGN